MVSGQFTEKQIAVIIDDGLSPFFLLSPLDITQLLTTESLANYWVIGYGMISDL